MVKWQSGKLVNWLTGKVSPTAANFLSYLPRYYFVTTVYRKCVWYHIIYTSFIIISGLRGHHASYAHFKKLKTGRSAQGSSKSTPGESTPGERTENSNKEPDTEVRICYGDLDEFGRLKSRPHRVRAGYGGSVTIKVHKTLSIPGSNLRSAVEKFMREDQYFPSEVEHSLVFHDGRLLYRSETLTPSQTLPDGTKKFTIQAYREWKEITYKRITLYLVRNGKHRTTCRNEE